MSTNRELKIGPNHIALFCIALGCTALFWIAAIGIAAFVVLATSGITAA